MYVPPDMLATWLNSELAVSKRESQTNRVLKAELDSLRETRKCFGKQGDVYFQQPRPKALAYATEKVNSQNERSNVLQTELDALMQEFSNLSNFELSKPE